MGNPRGNVKRKCREGRSREGPSRRNVEGSHRHTGIKLGRPELGLD